MQRKSFLDGNTFLRLPLRNPTSNNISRYGTGQHLNSFHLIPFRSISFHFIPFHSISFHFIPFHSISFFHGISIAPLQVHYYSEALPKQHEYCAGVSCRGATSNCE